MTERAAPVALATVVVAVHADARAYRTIQALRRQTLDRHKLQIVVVENGSQELADLADQLDLEYVHLPVANSAAARNAGLARAVGRYLLLTDADCVPARNWAEKLVAAMAGSGASLAGGRIVKHEPRTWVQRNAITIVDGQACASYLPTSNLPYVAGANAAFDTGLLREAGGFDTDLVSGNDVDACWRMQIAGGTLIIVPDAEVAHEDRATLPEHIRRFRRYARFQVLLFAKHKHRSGLRHVVDRYPFLRAASAARALPSAVAAFVSRGDVDPIQQVFLQFAESAGVLVGTLEGAAAYRQLYL